MSDFNCPECGGGFHVAIVLGQATNGEQPRCPWCGESIPHFHQLSFPDESGR